MAALICGAATSVRIRCLFVVPRVRLSMHRLRQLCFEVFVAGLLCANLRVWSTPKFDFLWGRVEVFVDTHRAL